MNVKQNVQSCIFVTRSSLIFYAKDLPDVMELPLSSDIARDLEIVNQASFERVLKSWLDQLKIIPGQTALILDSSVYFENVVDVLPVAETDPVVQSFLEIVPFSEVIVKSFPLQKGAGIVVVNQDFLHPLISVLERVGFTVVSASPDFILGVDFTQTPFNKDIAAQALSRAEILSQYTFITPEELQTKLTTEDAFLSVKIDAKVIGMIVVFVILIIVLIAIIVLQRGK